MMKVTVTRCLGLAGLFSLVNSQKTVDLPSFCNLPPVVATASVLAQYAPALSYCSEHFPGATNPITLVQSAGPELIEVVTSTVGITTDAFTTTTLIATAVITITPSPAVITTETVTFGIKTTTTILSLYHDPLPREKRSKESYQQYGRQHGGLPGHRGSGQYGKQGGYKLHPGHGAPYAVNAPQPYDHSTLDTSITTAPSASSAFDPAAVFESLQLLDSTIIGPVCTCIEAPEVILTISALPVATNTEWIMTTVTVFTTAVPQLVATVSVATTETVTASKIATTVTTTPPEATILCRGPESANIVANGGFDDADPGKDWNQIDFNFVDQSRPSGVRAISPPGLVQSNVTETDGEIKELSQQITNIDPSARYTVSFWYQPLFISPEQTSDTDGVSSGENPLCELRVEWGDVPLLLDEFATSWAWRNVVLQNISQPLETADLHFYPLCGFTFTKTNTVILSIDSVSILEQSQVSCEDA